MGILVSEKLWDLLVWVERRNDRLMAIKLVIGGSVFHVISAYAPWVGLGEEENRSFWEALDDLIREISRCEYYVCHMG